MNVSGRVERSEDNVDDNYHNENHRWHNYRRL